jgi:hypothetical protein
MRASLSRSVIGPAGQPCGRSKQIAESARYAAAAIMQATHTHNSHS